MRGIEAAFAVWNEVEQGRFASEALRDILSDVKPPERRLASTLVYSALRRLPLWKEIIRTNSRRPFHGLDSVTRTALIIGTAGVLELRNFVPGVLLNAIAQKLESAGRAEDKAYVHAVLHAAMRSAHPRMEALKSSAQLRDQAMFYGVPGWIASMWNKEYGMSDTRRLLKLTAMKSYMSLRVDGDAESVCAKLAAQKIHAWPSPEVAGCVRTASYGHPPSLEGYAQGTVTPQTESSIIVCRIAESLWKGGTVLDMCSGRGVKAGQFAKSCPDAQVDAWDLSAGRVRAAESEMKRLGIESRVHHSVCDATSAHSDGGYALVMTDVPCSGSGTWGRHPEAKWRLSAEELAEYSDKQTAILDRAVSLVAPGGKILYSTCSLLKCENESVVAEVLKKHPEVVEVPVALKNPHIRRGKPYGVLIWPDLPWVDGFYAAVLTKRR